MQKIKSALQVLIVALFVMLGSGIAGAAEQAQANKSMQANAQDKETIYGSQLMTREERAEHRAKMRGFKTKEEREAYRVEHHKKMQERAKKQGKTLPDMPSAQGCGPGCVGAGCGKAGCPETGSGGDGY